MQAISNSAAKRAGLVFAGGFAFWLVFLLALDPDLLFGGQHGWVEALRLDGLRVIAASALGSAMGVAQFLLVTRLPVTGPKPVARIAVHAAACLGLSLAALVIAGLGAPLVLPADSPRLATPLAQQIGNDWLLLAFVLGVFAMLLHLARRPAPAAQPQTRFAVPTRGGTLLVDAAEIDWIEAQGNYVALHIGAETHLLRDTLVRVAASLDAGNFVRVHRGAIVNTARLKRITRLTSGDALLQLATGAEIRASRTYAGALRDRIS